jgi:hypothetical protein
MPMHRKNQICIIPHIWKMSNKGRGVSELASPIYSFGTFVLEDFGFLTVFLASRYPCVCLCDFV